METTSKDQMAVTGIEVGDMTVAELRITIERHMAEAEMHMMTAHVLLEVVSRRELNIERGAEPDGWVQ
jgi:hypothetical protein